MKRPYLTLARYMYIFIYVNCQFCRFFPPSVVFCDGRAQSYSYIPISQRRLNALSQLTDSLADCQPCRLRARLVHESCVNDVLEVFGDVGVAMVAQLLDYLQALLEGAIVSHTCLPLLDTDCVIYRGQTDRRYECECWGQVRQATRMLSKQLA